MTSAARQIAANRSGLIFAAGILLAAGAAVSLDGSWRYTMRSGQMALDLSTPVELEPLGPRALAAEDRAAAERAWRYIAGNTRPETGWVDSVENFPSTTLWDQGSYLLALVAAERMGIIDDGEYRGRVDQLLSSFERLPLFEGKLPNKAYDTRTLAMVDYTNAEVPDGIGWSALDIGRMLMAFRALEKLNPEYGDRIRALLARWDLQAMAMEGELWGARREDGQTVYEQEGRIGYEQYGARSAALWGMDVLQAVSSRRAMDWTDVSGVEVPRDIRAADTFRAITPILSEPFMLQALELGLDSEGKLLADRIYRAQEERWRDTGQPTMVSEDHINQAPYFLYNSVFSNGEPWAVVTEAGEFHPELRTLSVKATFAWDAIYNTDYTDMLREQVEAVGDPEKGWPAGIYEEDGSLNDIYTLNTNAIVIEAMHYIAHGPLWRIR